MSAKKLDVASLLQREGMQADFQLKTPEDPKEKDLRLHKERLSFYFKDLGPYGLAAFFAVVLTAYSLVVFHSARSTASDKDHAWSIVMVIVGWAGGLIFGKATTK